MRCNAMRPDGIGNEYNWIWDAGCGYDYNLLHALPSSFYVTAQYNSILIVLHILFIQYDHVEC